MSKLRRNGAFVLAGMTATVSGLVPTVTQAADDDSVALQPCIVPLEASADMDIAKTLIVEKLGIEEDQFVYDYLAFNALWIDLTPEDCEALKDLPIEGIAGATIALEVSIAPDPLNPTSSGWPFTPNPDGMAGTSYGGGQVVPTGFSRVEATPGDYSGVDVAVVDTGVDQFHDDLNVVGGFDCTDPQNGDDNWGHDGYGHGTHVAGIIGALDNDRGVVGNAAGARIWSFKVLGDDGSGSFASVLCGMDQVAQESETIEVANLSLGGHIPPTACYSNDPVHDGFCKTANLGVIIVVSAGNDGIDSINSSPANYSESVVTVSALTDYDGREGSLSAPPEGIPPDYVDDQRALFSNYGSVVDFIAPGVDILSTLPMNTYGRASGTSMAAPQVAGVLAAWISQNPDYPQYAVQAVSEYSRDVWGADDWTGDIGQDHEPLVRFGAPAPTEEQLARWEEQS